ncbi:amino acid adenylation domain-containing protein [Pseudomonas sp. TH07]|uniref:non-ribosomal peptide synthetase n=1 Tax=Pseudomonas sp. TH07 TaxID=2796373 RepID=UPI001914D92F|nr:amino acid adenylation domain-containing protein [Pseudomonas sp. TH07]
MSVIELLATLKAKDIQLAVRDEQLIVQGNRQALTEPAVIAQLREYKPLLIEMIRSGQYSAPRSGQVEVPPNGILPGSRHITPDMLTLVQLDPATLERVLASVPGGAANVQDIYPLAPLQEGILYHHASAGQGDPYVMQAHFAFDHLQRLQDFAQALQGVIERHDILRTAVLWEGLETPLQVVWRQATLALQAVPLAAADGDILQQLHQRFDARHYRLDVTQAPLIRLAYAEDPANRRIVAVLLFHHMALDHSALDVVRQEMCALLLGQGHVLGPAVPFRNYVAQARLGMSEEEHEAFFRQMLGDIDEPTLPFGLHDVQGDGSAIDEFSLPLEPALCQRLRTQARLLGVSTASLFHTAWAQVLGALSGKRKVVFGTVLMGRMQGGGDNDRALGMFINTLPFRFDLDASAVQDAVKAAHGRLTTLLRHEHAPLALAQRCSAVAAPAPLFSSLLNYRHSAPPSANLVAAWQGISSLDSEERTNYPLTMSVDDLGQGFALTLLASREVDPQRVCDYLRTALENLAQALEQAPQGALNLLSVLPGAEREHLLQGLNGSRVDYPLGLSIGQRVAARAAEQADAVAALYQGQPLTYGELNRRANTLARRLLDLGVQPDDRVAVIARRGLDTLAGLLAVLKAGACYVPIDPAQPLERLSYLLDDCTPVAVLTQAGLRQRLPALSVPLIELEDGAAAGVAFADPSLANLTAQHLAYVIYTSGSTGLPKGVMVEHRTLGNLVDWHNQAFDLGPGRHTSSLAGFGFDAMAWEIWPALCAGATLHLPPARDGNEDLDELLAWWRAQPLDVSFLPTPVAEYAFSQNLGHPTLRTLLIGGDRLRHFSRDPGFAVINNYGPTEATVVATSGRIEPGQVLPIGKPMTNARVYLLDEQQRPVPLGVAGELYVGGAGVARGYLNRPELSAERFMHDPFSREPQARMYRSGDLARWLADGSLEYLGRNDDQVKVRGMRIELGEIENRLNQLPGVREAVVLAREDEPGQPRLVAYFTEQPAVEALVPAELRSHLLAHLPEYMVPVAYVRLDALPLTANGKLDRRALPKPDRAATFSRGYEAPQGELETTLAQIWAEVLQVEQVGRGDHFFELGGHSLLAMRMVSQVRLQLGVELALGELFANPELAAVAQVLARAGRSALPPILAVPRDAPLPLSFAQQRLWFIGQMQGLASAYNIPVALGLRGRLDADALQRALARIVARHESLRSRFILEHDEPRVQITPAEAGFQLHYQDLRGQPAAALQEQVRGHGAQAFDLQQGPLIRGQLLHLADEHHVLLLALHHIVADGWSMGVLTRELVALYAAFSQGRDDPLPPLALQYGDFALWQRRWLSGELLLRQSAYWQQALAGAPALLLLPTDRPRPPQQAYAGGCVEVALDPQLSAGMQALSQRHGCTLYMTLLAGWSLLLSKLSGQDDLVIGSPVANRTRAEVEGLIGLFVNTLALRIEVAPEHSVETLLAQVRDVTLQAQAHQDLPFEQVVELTRPQRSLSHSPLFQNMLAWDSGSGPGLAQAMSELHLQLEAVSGGEHVAKFDLSLTLGLSEGRICGSLVYATALFEHRTLERYLGYFEVVLQAMVANDQRPLGQISLLDPEARAQVLQGFNPAPVAFAQGQTLHGRFEAQAARTPQALALQVGEQQLSYRELNERANQLAHHLREQGVGPDSRVAICVERGLGMVVGLLAILKAGGAYVPLDPSHPGQRLAWLLEDCAPAAVLVEPATLGLLGQMALPLINLDQRWLQPSTNPQVPGLTAQHLVYVIYTSGSTGLPKGVMLEHHSLLNLVDWHNQAFAQGPGSHTSSVAGFGFDAMAWEVWPALCVGATLHLPPAGIGSGNLDQLLDWWRGQPLDVSFLPTPVAEYAFAQALGHPTLRTLLIGGDRLRQFTRDQRFKVINNYGPTEAAVVATSGPIEAGGPLHIGTPIANARVYLLDEQRRPVPVGVAGELYVGGAGVARGYLHRPELTAERFVDDPFTATPGARMYRSGDLARWLADGSLDYLGRNDDQVKIRGVRIELGEIETRLNAYPGVKEALLLAREDQPGQARLVAYFTALDPSAAPQPGELRGHLLSHLPEYMVPVAYVRLDALPLTANGKLDRRALPAPDLAALFSRDYEAPQGPLETGLAQIWADLLQVERVGRRDHFFELGGHSLLAMRMVSQVRLQLGLELALSNLFANPELAAVAQALAQARPDSLPPIVAQSAEGHLPLSFAQQRLWFLAQIEGAGSAYNIPLGLRLRGPLDVAALTQALEGIVRRHEVLRSRFVQVEDQPQVLIAAAEGLLSLGRHDLSADPQALQALVQGEAAQPFDLARGPLIRGHLAQLGAEHHVLLLTLHHSVADGWSMGVLTRELMALYAAFSQGQGDPLPPLAVQYSDFALWQRRWLGGERLQQQSAYWQQALAGAPALLSLPTDRPRPAQQNYAGGSVELRLDPSLTEQLKALSRRHGSTLYMTLLAGWGALLGRLAGQAEVVIGSPVANRTRAEVEGLIGLFVNTLALRIELPPGLSVATLLAQVRDRVVQAQEHQDLPFEQVVEISRPQRSLSHSPLFQSMLSWDGQPGAALALDALQLEVLEGGEAFAKFDLALNLGEAQGQIVGSLVYASALFDGSTIERYAGYFQRLLRAMVADDQGLLEQLPLLEPHQREQLLVGFNATQVAFDLEQSIHGLFEAQVQRSPDAPALVTEGGQLSYRQLNARANQLARHLREQGVGPDTRVAICVERGLEMVIGLLAILKAGGGYVPIDPGYPAERIAYMLADSAPVALLLHGATRHLLPEVAAPLIDLDQPLWHHQPHDDLAVPGSSPRNLAYVIYTSGSTGQPKGVINEHRALVNRLLWMQQAYGLTAADAVLQKTPFSFDVSVWEFFWPLMTGARLVMARPDGHKDPLYLSQVIQAEGISTVHFVPSMLDVFLAQGQAARCTGLLRVICSGEALPGSLVRRFKGQLPGSELHNLYGPTEAAVDVSAWNCAGPLEQTPDNTPIGKPIANTCLYVLDGQLQPVPLGVTGELYIGGVQVARGYLNRPQLNAERFVHDPFSRELEARLYRTGDVARYLADGNLEYLGRNDDQVKIRGLRIELGEIQARLTQLPGIKEAVVLAREDVPGNKRLVAYCTTADASQRLDIEQLRSQLLLHLPEYMVPALFVHLQALPLSPNGKLERKALPAPGLESMQARPYEAPIGATETLLAGLWAELLNVQRVGRHDHFFELGGHSLLAITLIGRMRRAGLTADVRVLFGQPTLAALAAAVGEGREVEVPANLIGPDCPRITPQLLPLLNLEQEAIDRIVANIPGGVANVQDIYPLAPLQAGILYHHILSNQGDPYLLQAQFAFDSQERLQAFTQALQAVIERNDILRTAVFWDGLEEPVQVVLRQAGLQVQELRVRASGGEVLEQLLTRFDPRHFRLDLAQAPLLRLYHAWDKRQQRVVALLLFHHLVMDHVGLEVLQQEVQACLLDQREQLAPAVPYRNYVAQTRLGMGEQEHEAFFRDMLGDIDEPTLPFGLAQVQGDGRDIEEARLALGAPLNQRLRNQARQLGVSAASLVHLAWAQVLGAVSGQEHAVFGSVLFGRMQGGEGAERALGVFINTLPLRVDLGEQGVRAAVLATHARLARLLAHEHAPLALAQRCSGVAPPTPLFSALLNYRHSAVATAPSAAAGAAWHGMHLLKAEERSNYLLTLSVDDLGSDFVLSAMAAAGIGAQRVCTYMQTALDNLVQALEQTPQQAIGQLSILSAQERQQLLVQFNASDRDVHHDQTVHRLFEAQAQTSPQAVAAVQGGQSMSYHELNRRANQLAHRLLDLGVQPGDNVALLLPRSFELLLGQLAINKCAAVYVPLDINAPAERLSFMLDDCQAVLLLTRGEPLLQHPVPRLDLLQAGLDGWPSQDPQLPQSSEAVAYIMYTSGSTGTPKGVLVPHRAIVRLVRDNGYADFNPLDRLAFVSNPAFDASTMEVWGALLNGGQVLVIEHQTLLEPEVFGRALVDSGATVLFLTTSLFNQYVQLIPEALKGLRMLLCGGERADPGAFRRLLEQAPDLRLVHCYGPTETTTFATTFEVRALAADADSVAVGGPIANTRVYVLDRSRQPVPLGAVGEIYIGGQGVARGYLNRPQLTAEKFVHDPFVEQPGRLMYRTGDLGRWLGEGRLECIGRTDDQVKLRGFRIELGEIETRLAACPGVREAAVLVREVGPGDKRLVAYYTRHATAATADSEGLRVALQSQLPDYMVPAAYVLLEHLPLTANGKLDRKALPAPELQTLAGRAYEAPITALEQSLARVWAEVLHVPQVGRHDSFFELGGHSLLAIRLLNRMQQEGLKVTLAELFQHASVESIATLLGQRTAVPDDQQSVIEVRAGGSQPPLFLVHEFSGMDLYFPVLGRHIEGDFPIYGLPGIALQHPQLHTLEGLAARLVRLIRSVQAEGPYRLAGWSFGGVLAYEVALQLQGQDQVVQFLGLIDSYMPRLTDQGKARWNGPHALKRHLLLQCESHWTVQGVPGEAALDRVRQLGMELEQHDFASLLQACRERQVLNPQLLETPASDLERFLAREVAHGHAMAHYALHPIALPVHLFCARERPTELARRSTSLGWGDVLGPRLQAVSVPGDHLSMMQAPHVQTLGQAISAAMAAAAPEALAPHQPLLSIQTGRPGQAPIFCVPGAGDSVTGFIGLTDALGPDWPLFGLQPRGLDGQWPPHSQVESAAEHGLSALEQVCPEGPLHLVGHSFGGWVAYALAARLQARGRTVASLTLIDSEAPGGNGGVARPYTATAVLERLIEALQLASGKSLGIEPVAFAAADDPTQLRLLHAGMVRVGQLSPRSTPEAIYGTVRTFGAALRTVYQPQLLYRGPVRLVLAEDPALDSAGNLLEQEAMIRGWRQYVEPLSVWHGPGNHFSILKAPDVYSLAAWWQEGLALAVGEGVS